jgi:3-deoxy-manno-octulosonate cytidylyltransferase (CMP-KDO synthetase)
MARRIVGVIPAHLESARLPRKPLLPILGHPMIAWVYARARAAKELSELLVATDSDEVLEWCRSLRIPVILTSPAHRSGTERIHEVMARQAKDGAPGDIYVNIQGDEPLVDTSHIELLLQPLRSSPRARVSSLKVALDPSEASNPNKVKVVSDSSGRALYFSRSPIPHHRASAPAPQYYKHLGFYAYSAEALEAFKRAPRGQLETSEGLEQLRFLENGIEVIVLESSMDTIGVDTPEDLATAEEHIRQAGMLFPEF